jgi:hypothetical protein
MAKEINIQVDDVNVADEGQSDLSNIEAGDTLSFELNIQNTGDAVLTISGIAITGTDKDIVTQVDATPATVAAGQQADITFNVAPTFAYADQAALSFKVTVTSDDGDEPTYEVNFIGSVDAGEISIKVDEVSKADESTVALGNLNAGETATFTVEITNGGAGPLVISSIVASGDYAGYLVQNDSTPDEIAASEAEEVEFSFITTSAIPTGTAITFKITVNNSDASEATYEINFTATLLLNVISAPAHKAVSPRQVIVTADFLADLEEDLVEQTL